MQDMLDWTQIKHEKFLKKREKFDLRELFTDLVEMMKFKA